jgi:hypothetical protein
LSRAQGSALSLLYLRACFSLGSLQLSLCFRVSGCLGLLPFERSLPYVLSRGKLFVQTRSNTAY